MAKNFKIEIQGIFSVSKAIASLDFFLKKKIFNPY